MRPSFKQYLFAQHERRDPVGHLAFDFRADYRELRYTDEPPLPRRFTYETAREYLKSRGACDGALTALESAHEEWLALTGEQYTSVVILPETQETGRCSEESSVKCPTCGFHCNHVKRVFTRMGIDDLEAQVYPGTQAIGFAERERRSCLVVQFACENGHPWELRLQQHKGPTYVATIPGHKS